MISIVIYMTELDSGLMSPIVLYEDNLGPQNTNKLYLLVKRLRCLKLCNKVFDALPCRSMLSQMNCGHHYRQF